MRWYKHTDNWKALWFSSEPGLFVDIWPASPISWEWSITYRGVQLRSGSRNGFVSTVKNYALREYSEVRSALITHKLNRKPDGAFTISDVPSELRTLWALPP